MFKPFGFLWKQRIRCAADFSCIFRKGKRLSKNGFVCRILKTDRDYARLGIVIRKKYCRLSSDRNRLRRLVRERFRLMQAQLIGKDVVVAIQSPIDKLTNQEQAQCIEQLFTQLAAFCVGSS